MSVAYLPLASFSFAGSITPGPNNLMLAASGANFGWRRTLPHLMGVVLGFMFMLTVVSAGLGAVIREMPTLHDILRVAGGAYLLYLAYRIATAAPAKSDGRGKPLTFLEASLFQWLNPKAWAMALTMPASFMAPDPAGGTLDLAVDVGMMLAIHGPISLACVATWTLFGIAIGRFLAEGNRRLWFNRAMAALLVVTVYWIVAPG
ncbi:LysE family translocator [Marivibrio halodurans]|uniref:LysE family translocator n=1 Tax=Marivibrio halodurans TaxID=2039722 RepID=A0A8J7S424_9PROT|nr:LysE family translocator [Marivibrio halodurans]MBP5858344.1 LysE family translocator [Marivibrio halodurans]